MPIEVNPLETARFGIVAARVTDAAAGLGEILDAARRSGVEMLTARVDVGDLPRVHAFEAAGFQLMDTLVYYSGDLAGGVPLPGPAGAVTLRAALPEDAGAAAAVARAAFAGYGGHYHADPRLDRAAADAAYVDWAARCVEGASPSTPVILSEEEGRVTGFLAMRRNSPAECEGVLNAVHPGHQGRGIYSQLLAHALLRSRQAGAQRVVMPTQINNYRVQRVWARLGLTHHRSLYTFHKWFDR